MQNIDTDSGCQGFGRKILTASMTPEQAGRCGRLDAVAPTMPTPLDDADVVPEVVGGQRFRLFNVGNKSVEMA